MAIELDEIELDELKRKKPVKIGDAIYIIDEEEWWDYLEEHEEEDELPECFGLSTEYYSEHCEICEFRDACEEIAKANENEERDE